MRVPPGACPSRATDVSPRYTPVWPNEAVTERARAMRLQMFKSKIHRATVTQADLDYEGSVTIDEELLEAADILEFEAVHVWNVTRGTRLQTYALKGARGSGVICINGAAAHLAKPGDLVIIATFCELEREAARRHLPTVVLVDAHNRITDANAREVPGPQRRAAS